MVKPSKNTPVIILSFCVLTSLLPVYASAEYQNISDLKLENAIKIVNESNKQIIICSDIIDWRYKKVGNQVYRRQYNYSKQEWIGEWELC